MHERPCTRFRSTLSCGKLVPNLVHTVASMQSCRFEFCQMEYSPDNIGQRSLHACQVLRTAGVNMFSASVEEPSDL
jgi:hypothetical protein